MKGIIKSIIDKVGLKTVLLYVWEIAYSELKPLAQKTETKFDDKGLEILDALLNETINDLKN